MFHNAPAWVMRGARFDFDFANLRFWGGSFSLNTGAGGQQRNGSIFIGGAAVATDFTMFCPNSKGILQTFPAGGPRITDLGLWIESTTTNYALRCRDFTNASWTKTNMNTTKTSILGADNSTGSATKLTATASSATATQAITLTSRELISSVYIKRVTGTGAVYISQDNGSTKNDVSSLINSNTFTMVQLSASATLANPTPYVELAVSGDEIIIDFWQTENYSFPTTRILTTTASRSRAGAGADSPSCGTDGTSYNDGRRVVLDTYSSTPMSCVATFAGNPVSSNPNIKGGGNNNVTKLRGGCGTTANFGTNDTNLAISANTGTVSGTSYASGSLVFNKSAGRMSGLGCAICLNGGTIATGTGKVVTLSPDPSDHMGFANNGSGGLAINGVVNRLAIWNKELTDGEMMEFTR